MLITMADTGCGGLLAGHDAITVHGPRGLTTLVNAFRTFVNVKDIGLRVSEFGDSGAAAEGEGSANGGSAVELPPIVQNELVTITPIIIQARPANGAAAAGEAAQDAAQNGDGGGGSGEPEAKRARLDTGGVAAGGGGPLDISTVAVESPAACYACELPPIPGKFLPQKVGESAGGQASGGWSVAFVQG